MKVADGIDLVSLASKLLKFVELTFAELING